MVAVLRVMLSEEEVREFGRVYQEETAVGTAQVLPQTLTARPVANGYGLEELAKDLPRLREEVLGQANVRTVDLSASGDGALADSAEFTAGMAAYGHGVMLVTASAPGGHRGPGRRASRSPRRVPPPSAAGPR